MSNTDKEKSPKTEAFSPDHKAIPRKDNSIISDNTDKEIRSILAVAEMDKHNWSGDTEGWLNVTISALNQLIAQQEKEARKDELEKAVQQFVFNTDRNPNNFSEYAHARLKELTTTAAKQGASASPSTPNAGSKQADNRLLALNKLYAELEDNKPPPTFNQSERNYNEGLYQGQLKAMELVCAQVFGTDGDQLRAEVTGLVSTPPLATTESSEKAPNTRSEDNK